jgi:putative oxidoreductase
MATRPPSQHHFPGLSKLYSSFDEWGYLLIRVAAGAILIPHGMQKLFGSFGGPGMANFIGALQKVGYTPAAAPFLGWLIALVEFGGGILLVLGLFTRPIAFAVLIFMLEAARHHLGVGGYFWTRQGNEYPLFFAAVALYLLIRGGGPYSLDSKMGKEI